jgi:hypothetical protein
MSKLTKNFIFKKNLKIQKSNDNLFFIFFFILARLNDFKSFYFLYLN